MTTIANKLNTMTRSAKINAAKRELSNDNLLALAAVTGKKADRANAADAAMSIIAKLLTGQAAGGNREEAVLVLRACMGLEAACFDNAFAHFSGSLADVASMGIWAKPHQAALTLLTQREEAARKLGVWIDAQARFEREGKALRKAADAANADKVAAKAKAFLDTVAPYIERAQARIEEIAARKAALQETAEAKVAPAYVGVAEDPALVISEAEYAAVVREVGHAAALAHFAQKEAAHLARITAAEA